MRLNEAQARFKETMLDHPKVLEDLPADFAAIFNEGDIPLSTRLKVYRNNIVASLTDLLLATFPVMEKLVGKEFLEVMARSFILENPPAQGCLSFYGAGFDEFIAGFKPAQGLPYLPDIARMEIAINDAYYAPDDKPLRAEALAKIAPEELGALRLSLRTSACMLSSRYPLPAIKDFCFQDDGSAILDINSGGCALMVYRPSLESLVVTLGPGEYFMLSLLYEGRTLGEATTLTMERFPDFDIQKFLARHMELETFSAFKPNT